MHQIIEHVDFKKEEGGVLYLFAQGIKTFSQGLIVVRSWQRTYMYVPFVIFVVSCAQFCVEFLFEEAVRFSFGGRFVSNDSCGILQQYKSSNMYGLISKVILDYRRHTAFMNNTVSHCVFQVWRIS
eukprot:TRINITY_DN4022_c1_g2_i1.p5 TRINITY_DN4022_c1_g2~~TRINITY_DN4022_c1_g2_i1.p5  ORF type:complete len:126 (-),score=12.27 TRINITY_DN4022_c1_g2_i1:105-482(-)